MASMGGGGKMTRPPGDRDGRRPHPYRKEPRQPPPADERIENKLYVGNLDHRVTEYHVLKMFTPFGKIKREEFLWHTHGPKRGEPRGYAFVEYATREEAERARAGMNGKPAFGRPLVVRFVDEKVVTYNQDAPVWRRDAPSDAGGGAAGGSGGGGAGGLSAAAAKGDAPGAAQKSISKSAKIAAIQQKLRMMEQEDKLRSTAKKPPTSLLPSSAPEPPAGWGGGMPMDPRDAGRGPNEQRAPQSRTLLTSGHRWSAWG